MKLTQIIFYVLLFVSNSVFSNSISGSLNEHADQTIKLYGYSGFKTSLLSKTKIDNNGMFELNYENYSGMAYLACEDKSVLFIILNENKIILKGMSLSKPQSVHFEESQENRIYETYLNEHAIRESALAGWKHLYSIYNANTIIKDSKHTFQIISAEIIRINNEDSSFLNRIDSAKYVSWFLPIRKLLDDMSVSVHHFKYRIPEHISRFRNIDFTDVRLLNSGILDDLLEGHYWMIENSGLSIDTMYNQMNQSTDYLFQNLTGHDELLNDCIDFLFDYFEKHSLFEASEHIAFKGLSQNSCTLDADLSKQLETYRVMKVGNNAPDIKFEGTKMIYGVELTNDVSLATINSEYTLVTFGASWCPKCAEEFPKIKMYYSKWKAAGVEVVSILLDTDLSEYKKFVKDLPWLTNCNTKGWENQVAKDYYVFSTPTMFLLDKNRKILLRPSSVEQVNSWINYSLKGR